MSLRLLPIARIAAVPAAASARARQGSSDVNRNLTGRRPNGQRLNGNGNMCRLANAPVLRLEDSHSSRSPRQSLSGRSSTAIYLNRRLTGRLPFLSS